MKTFSTLLALTALPASLAHTVWTDFFVNGVAQGDGVAMRMPKDGATASFPLSDLSSNTLACNVDGDKGVARVQSVPDGAMLSFEFRSWPNDPSKERLDSGHKGPCAVYLKKVDSAIEDPGHGDGWFKIFDDGYSKEDGQWCTDKLIANNGLLSVALPKGLKGGYYLARPEVLALHNAFKGDPQFYAGCAQIFVEGKGDLVPESTVSIPGYVKAGEESVSFNIYSRDNAEYPTCGPAVAKLSSSSSAAGADMKTQSTQTEGQQPEGAIAMNGNWFGFEVSSYSDEAGCWDSAEECWAEGRKCFDQAPVTGSKGCSTWQDKCQGINDACSAGNFNGPPNKGKSLIPKAQTIDVGLVLPTQGGGVDSSPQATNTPARSSAPSTTSQAAPAKPSASENVDNDDAAAAPVAEAQQTTTPAPEAAPAPTEKPEKPVCPHGYHCSTSTTTVVKTEIAYATVYPDMKRRSLHQRR